MVDCVGKELNIGDKVVCADRQYADLLIGEIIGFTPKKARVRYHRSEYGDAYGVHGQNEQLKESYQIFKYEEKVHAHWKLVYDDSAGWIDECSHCGTPGDGTLYCSKCGAIMDENKQDANI